MATQSMYSVRRMYFLVINEGFYKILQNFDKILLGGT
jgi:hypothetical protein